jgi:hypothetical protein
VIRHHPAVVPTAPVDQWLAAYDAYRAHSLFPVRLPAQQGVQRSIGWSAGLDSADTDNLRRSLSGGERRTPRAIGRLDCRQAQ